MKDKLKEICYINPVNLDNLNFDEYGLLKPTGTIKNFIYGLRPAHKSGLPVISTEYTKNKQIINHNYGHSGVGYAILFGTVNESIRKFEKKLDQYYIDKDEEITIIGMGIVGLTTAIKLNELGYKNIMIIGEDSSDMPSYRAGGLIEFSLTTIYNRDQFAIMNSLFEESILEYIKINNDQNHYLKNAVMMVDYFTDLYQKMAGLDYLAKKGILPKGKDVILKVKGVDNEGFAMHHFKTFHVIADNFMKSLKSKVQQLKIKTIFRKIDSLEEIKSKSIFNCSGLGALYLNNDKDMYPICGNGFELKDQKLDELPYIIRFQNVPGLENDPINGSLYFMPKVSGFIGGSYIKNYDGKDQAYNREIVSNLAKRASYLFKGIKPKF